MPKTDAPDLDAAARRVAERLGIPIRVNEPYALVFIKPHGAHLAERDLSWLWSWPGMGWLMKQIQMQPKSVQREFSGRMAARPFHFNDPEWALLAADQALGGGGDG